MNGSFCHLVDLQIYTGEPDLPGYGTLLESFSYKTWILTCCMGGGAAPMGGPCGGTTG